MYMHGHGNLVPTGHCVAVMVNIKTNGKALGKYSSLKSTKFCEAAALKYSKHLHQSDTALQHLNNNYQVHTRRTHTSDTCV